jgi:hypothetical protein
MVPFFVAGKLLLDKVLRNVRMCRWWCGDNHDVLFCQLTKDGFPIWVLSLTNHFACVLFNRKIVTQLHFIIKFHSIYQMGCMSTSSWGPTISIV